MNDKNIDFFTFILQKLCIIWSRVKIVWKTVFENNEILVLVVNCIS